MCVCLGSGNQVGQYVGEVGGDPDADLVGDVVRYGTGDLDAMPYGAAMERTLLDQVIETNYGQFDLTWGEQGGFDGDFDRFFDGQLNGLVGAAHSGSVYLNLARRSGGSPVRVVLRDSRPEQDRSYQDIVEVSIEIPPAATVHWASWAGESGGVFTGIPAGMYRLRVSARDRDVGREGEWAEGPVDAYLLELWLAPVEPDAILRVGSHDAEYWHREVGSRR